LLRELLDASARTDRLVGDVGVRFDRMEVVAPLIVDRRGERASGTRERDAVEGGSPALPVATPVRGVVARARREQQHGEESNGQRGQSLASKHDASLVV